MLTADLVIAKFKYLTFHPTYGVRGWGIHDLKWKFVRYNSFGEMLISLNKKANIAFLLADT